MKVLASVRARLTLWLLLQFVLMALAAAGLVALGFVVADLALQLPEGWRRAAPRFVMVVAALVLVIGLVQWMRWREGQLARLFERADPTLGDRLTNAVQFAQMSGPGPVREFFRREAVEAGRVAATRAKTWPAVRRGVATAASLAVFTASVWTILVLGAGEVWQVVQRRFLDPAGDHPPFSRIKIEVAPGLAEVLYGAQLEVHALTHGPPVDRLWLVTEGSSNSARTIMFLAPDRSFFQTLANLRAPTEYYVTDGRARSERFSIKIRYTPQITMVGLTTTFPDYTSKPTHTGKLSVEPVAWPANSSVAFRVASNRPLGSGRLALTPILGGEVTSVVLQPTANPNVVTGAFTLKTPVTFHLSVRDTAGLDSAEATRGQFNVSPDERPRLLVLEPSRNAVATPSVQVPVKVQAMDDYGISRLVWLRGHNRSVERPVNLKMELKGGQRMVESSTSFDLAKLGVRPGDVIEYYFETADNFPQGPNIVLSRLYKLEIISDEQYQQILRQAAARKALFEPYFTMGPWLRRIAERARTLQTLTGQSDSTATAEGEALGNELDKYEEALSKLLAHPLMFDVEQGFRDTLVAQHTRLGAARRKLAEATAGGQADSKQAAELAKTLRELVAEEDNLIGQPAQQIAAVVQVLARADDFLLLAQQQAAVAQLLRRFAETTNLLSRLEQIELQELAHQQRQIQDGLHSLLTQLPDLLHAVPAEADYDLLREDVTTFIKRVIEARIQHDMAASVAALAEPNSVVAQTRAQEAAEKMRELIGKCEGLMPQGESALQARFAPKLPPPGLGQTLSQILSALNSSNSGGGGRDGVSMFNDQMGLYGPNSELAGKQGEGHEAEGSQGGNQGPQVAAIRGASDDSTALPPGPPGRVRLQPNARFPLRYRELVGEYFKAIAESGSEQEDKQ